MRRQNRCYYRSLFALDTRIAGVIASFLELIFEVIVKGVALFL